MSQSDNHLREIIRSLTQDVHQWKARAEAAENGEIPYLREQLAVITADRDRVPDREKVAMVIWAAFGHGGPPLEARGVPYGTWAMALASADAAITAMQETKPMTKWHLASKNDGLFITDTPPRPSTDDEWHDRPDGPSMILNVTDLPQAKAQAIVDAHNAAIQEKENKS